MGDVTGDNALLLFRQLHKKFPAIHNRIPCSEPDKLIPRILMFFFKYPF
jgi:hypothetical protein